MRNIFLINEILGKNDFVGVFLIIVLIALILSLIWFYLIEIPRQKKEKNTWLKNNNDKILIIDEVSNIVNQISNQVVACKKCSNREFQFWQLSEEIIVRCIVCKRKENYSTSNSSELLFVFNSYFDLLHSTYNMNDSILSKHLKGLFLWDFVNVRKGNSLASAIFFTAKGENKEESFKESTVKRTRRISQKVKNQVWKRDEGKCVQCGSKERLEFDHIIPFSKGGSNTYRNIQLLCENCNRMKSANI